jgi:hypothetical protein
MTTLNFVVNNLRSTANPVALPSIVIALSCCLQHPFGESVTYQHSCGESNEMAVSWRFDFVVARIAANFLLDPTPWLAHGDFRLRLDLP